MVEETGPYGHRTMKFSEAENEHERANLGGEEEKEKVGYGGSDGTRLLEGSVKLAPCAIICISISATKRAVNVHKKAGRGTASNQLRRSLVAPALLFRCSQGWRD